MLNTPEQEFSEEAEVTAELETESPEVTEETEEEGTASEGEQPEEIDENEAYLVGDREITPAELKRLEDKAKNIEAGYTKKRQVEAAEHKDKIASLESIAKALELKASAIERFIEEDENAVDWDGVYSVAEQKKLERKFAERREALKKAQDEAKKVRAGVTAEKLKEANQVVISYFAEWQGNEANQKKDLDAAYKYAKSIGYTDERINSIVDAGEFIALIEGAKLKSIKEAKPESKKKVTAAKRIKAKSVSTKAKSLADLWYPD
jgi:hypothetical protein